MPAPFLLDTNAYALLFRRPKTEACERIERMLTAQGEMTFFLPNIVSVEIHSVLGKYRRGGNSEQQEQCDRHVIGDSGNVRCTHTCVFPAQARIKLKVFRDLQKLLRDIEDHRGNVKATLLPLGASQFNLAKQLLLKYCDRFAFGSHDAMVAASAINATTAHGIKITVVTQDKGLKALCAAEKIPTYDPQLHQLIT